MAGIDDLIASMSGAEIDPSGPTGAVNRLAEQLALTSVEDNNDSREPPISSATNYHGDQELEEGEIREDKSEMEMESPSSEAPLKQVLNAYYQNLRRLPPNSQSCLSSLLQQRKGIQVYAEYNIWLSGRGWELQLYSLPKSVLDLEILSLAMAIEIKERWGTRHKTRPMNAVYIRNRKVCGEMVQVAFMPPMSPPGHPHYPYWLPDPDAGEGYDAKESKEKQFRRAREFLFGH